MTRYKSRGRVSDRFRGYRAAAPPRRAGSGRRSVEFPLVLTSGVVFGRAVPKKRPLRTRRHKTLRANTRTAGHDARKPTLGEKKNASLIMEAKPALLPSLSALPRPPFIPTVVHACAIGNFRNIYPRASYCRAKNGRNFIVSSIFSYVFTSGAREIVFRDLSLRRGVCPCAASGLFPSRVSPRFATGPLFAFRTEVKRVRCKYKNRRHSSNKENVSEVPPEQIRVRAQRF